MADQQRPVALITGASSGIGLELARCLAAAGYDLYLVGRNLPTLAALAHQLIERHSIAADTFEIDLLKPGALRDLVQQLNAKERAVDVLVNCAGVGLRGRFFALDWQRQSEIIQTNLQALTELTSLILPSMLARRQGRILNVASLAGFVPGPMMAVYSATKAYVLSFSEALSEELIGSGVTVTCLCPAATATPFIERAQMKDALIVKMGTESAALVARIGFEALMAGKPLALVSARDRVMIFLTRFAPRRWARVGAKFLLS